VAALSLFVDPARRPELYGDAERLARRTAALHRAKSAGPPVAGVIVDLAVDYLSKRSVGIVMGVRNVRIRLTPVAGTQAVREFDDRVLSTLLSLPPARS